MTTPKELGGTKDEMYKSLTQEEKEEYNFKFANTKTIFLNYLHAGRIFLISSLIFLAIAGVLVVVTTEVIQLDSLYLAIKLSQYIAIIQLITYTVIIFGIGFIITTYRLFLEYKWINNIKYKQNEKVNKCFREGLMK